MSADEKKQFDTMAKEMAAIKRWLPIFLFVGTLIGASITGTSWFDNNIARKADTDSIKKEVHELRNDVVDIKTSLNSYKEKSQGENVKVNNRIDSLDRIVYVIQKKHIVKFVTESYPNGHNGKPVLKEVN